MSALVVDNAGNIYFTDTLNNRVREISRGIITTIAGNGTAAFSGDGGPAASASLKNPFGLAIDPAGSLYVADQGNFRVRKISNGVISTFAGNGNPGYSGDGGAAANASIDQPYGLAMDGSGNLYVAQPDDNRVLRISNGIITVVAGNGSPIYANTPIDQIGDGGPATSALVNAPTHLAADNAGNLYISDQYDGRVREVSNGIINTVAGGGTSGDIGDGGPATSASVGGPHGLFVDSAGNLYIAESYRVRKVSNGIISTIAGNGLPFYFSDGLRAVDAELGVLYGIARDPSGNLYMVDAGRIQEISDGVIRAIAGSGIYYLSPGDGGPAINAGFYEPQGVAVDAAGNVYIADLLDHRVRKVSNGIITTVAGTGTAGYSGDGGPAANARVSFPSAVAVDAAGNLYIADAGNNRIRKVSGGVITTIAGNGTSGYSGDGGPAVDAALYDPSGLAVDSSGSVYIADTYNYRVRKISGGIISTVAGSGARYIGEGGPSGDVALASPTGVAVDKAGSLYIADSAYRLSRVLKVTNGAMTTIAGGGDPNLGPRDGWPATSACLYGAYGVAVDGQGNVYVSDQYLYRIVFSLPLQPPRLQVSHRPTPSPARHPSP